MGIPTLGSGRIFPVPEDAVREKAIALPAHDVDALFEESARAVLHARIDIAAGLLECGGKRLVFALTPRERLLLERDIDWIGATLAHRQAIAAFEAERLARQPWLARMLDRGAG